MQAHNRICSTVTNEKERGMCGVDNTIQFKFGRNRSAIDYDTVEPENEQHKVNTLLVDKWLRYSRSITLGTYIFLDAFDNRTVLLCPGRRLIPSFISFGLRKGTNTYPLGSMNRRASYGLLTFSFRQ